MEIPYNKAVGAKKMAVSVTCRELDKTYLNKSHLGNLSGGYLELLGQGAPHASNLPEIKLMPNTGSYTWSAPNSHIHEYFWTLSLTGEPGWEYKLKRKDAILVQLIFHTNNTSCLVRVLTTTLKPPFVIKKTMVDRLKEILTTTKPVRSLAKDVAPQELGTLVDAIEILAEDSVPRYHAYPWYSKMFTSPVYDNTKGAEGVEFRIDRKAFRNLGNRIMGSVGIMIISKSKPTNHTELPIKLEARARVSFKTPFSSNGSGSKSNIWIPLEEEFRGQPLFLELNPTLVES